MVSKDDTGLSVSKAKAGYDSSLTVPGEFLRSLELPVNLPQQDRASCSWIHISSASSCSPVSASSAPS